MNEIVLYALLAVSCVSLLLVILLLSKSNNGQGLQNEMAILQSKIAQLEHSIKTDFSIKSYLILKNVVDAKKEEIKKKQEETTLLFSYISKDITRYVLWTYF
jgi:hypothetical protein